MVKDIRLVAHEDAIKIIPVSILKKDLEELLEYIDGIKDSHNMDLEKNFLKIKVGIMFSPVLEDER